MSNGRITDFEKKMPYFHFINMKANYLFPWYLNDNGTNLISFWKNKSVILEGCRCHVGILLYTLGGFIKKVFSYLVIINCSLKLI